jgi:preprotein translocase subunit SecY
MVVMWISEVITERGIGQGASLVIFINIVATLPKAWAPPSSWPRAATAPRWAASSCWCWSSW